MLRVKGSFSLNTGIKEKPWNNGNVCTPGCLLPYAIIKGITKLFITNYSLS